MVTFSRANDSGSPIGEWPGQCRGGGVLNAETCNIFSRIWYIPFRNEDGIHPQVEELEGLTNATIFLPSLEAFSQLPEPFIEMLAAEPANLLEFMLRQEGSL